MSKGWRLSVMLLAFHMPCVFALNDLVEMFPRPSGFISTDQIKRMSQENLETVRDDLNASIVALRVIIRRKDNQGIPVDKIASLARFQTQEAVEALLTVLREEIKRMQARDSEASREVFLTALSALGVIGAKFPHRYVENMIDLAKEFEAKAKANGASEIIIKKMSAVIDVMQLREENLVNVNDLLHAIEMATNQPAILLERTEKILKAGLAGQPEVLQALMDMEWRSSLYGKARKLPDAIYLMGLPGTGKDTAAEVFADALNGAKGAHQKHMYRLPLMKNRSDLWQLLGSSTGYVGSENLPPFLQFLVQHSDGKYKLEEFKDGQKTLTRIIANPDYKGETLVGYVPPNRGIIFVNEFHNWSKQLKDDFLKQALEKGVFTINNPNGGLNEIYVPIRFVIASNEGIRLTTSREANGQRQGKPLSFEQMMLKWESVHENKRALKAEILAGNGSPNQAIAGEATPGISEELLNRIPDRLILLMRPLSPEHLRQIANGYLEDLKNKLSDSPLLGKVTLTWSTELPKALQEYDYIAEENARPVLGRVMSLIEEPLLDAVRGANVSQTPDQEIHLDIELNPDNSRSLIITGPSGHTARQLIRTTKKDIAKPAISDERIDELAGLETYLKSNVFGIDDVLERLSERVLSIENEAAGARPMTNW